MLKDGDKLIAQIKERQAILNSEEILQPCILTLELHKPLMSEIILNPNLSRQVDESWWIYRMQAGEELSFSYNN